MNEECRSRSFRSDQRERRRAAQPHASSRERAKAAKTAYEKNTTLRDAVVDLGPLSGEEFDAAVVPGDMVGPHAS